MNNETTNAVQKQIVKVASCGGGLDSIAMIVHGIKIGDKPDIVAFVDTGDCSDLSIPGEWPSTYRYIDEVLRPLCEEHGIEFVQIDTPNGYPIRRGGADEAPNLFEYLWNKKQIPVSGPKRLCTIIAKVERFEAWLADRFPGQIVETWIGFEAGEEGRAAKDPNAGKDLTNRRNRFPLIEWGLCRCRCEQVMRDAGLPIPRKSACTFCPYASKGDWQTLARELPEQFAKIAELESQKPPTIENNIKLSIMGFSSIKLSAAQAKALAELTADRNATVRKGTLKALLARGLVTEAGDGYVLTQVGEEARDAGEGHVVGHKAPPLPEYVQGTYKPQAKPCEVCGASQRATKATGCSFLGEDEYTEVPV